MCRVLGVTRSWYYAQQRRGATRRQREDQVLLPKIKAAFEESDKSYGAVRVRKELRAQGTRGGKNRIWRLMLRNGLHVKNHQS
jgi:hypothetical protein